MSNEKVSPDKGQIDNTHYIQSLKYDLNALLAVDLTPKQIDSSEVGESRERRPGEVIIVMKKQLDASSNLTENTLLNPSAGVVFPGAVLKQDHTLAEGVPTPYTFPRGPLTIRVDLPGLEDKGVITIQSPTNVNVEVAIQKITDYWFDNVKNRQGYMPTIRAFSEAHKAYTKEQIGIECGFGAQWGKSQATAGLEVESTDEETIVYRVFKQIYYTVYVEEPELAGAIFAKGVNTTTRICSLIISHL
jgi:thiol-activated cytolysin